MPEDIVSLDRQPVDSTDADDTTDADVRDAIAAALRRESTALREPSDLGERATPAVLEAYEGALVQGLCRDGAREVATDAARSEIRRLIALE
jgi:hypothetical protein